MTAKVDKNPTVTTDGKFFLDTVSSWIESYTNADALIWLRAFINRSPQPEDIKKQLHLRIDRKLSQLTSKPFFGEVNGERLLMDDNCHPVIFTTRYKAMQKVTDLYMRGYEAAIVEGTFYKIKLVQIPILEVPEMYLTIKDDTALQNLLLGNS